MGPCSDNNLCRRPSQILIRTRIGGHAMLVSRITLTWIDNLTAASSGLLFLPPPYERMYGLFV
jgi:hypothetical protein